MKLRTTHMTGSDTIITDYCGNVVYENGVLVRLMTYVGYIVMSASYHYFIEDHQGNVRVVADEGVL
ncbi:hypothetical protein [Bacteroides acidifaciens]|uniref:hypothetical protein n=1 Tax=Bacteroides acidifaciens TaxID=85831 RepID=UPI0020CA784F|nr:hypothetical protein [Bacteroides acidifaciens]